MAHIDIVFDGPPDAKGPRFIEVEDHTGCSIGFGEWVARADGLWALRLPAFIDEAGRLRPAADPVRRDGRATPYAAEDRRAGPTFVPVSDSKPPTSGFGGWPTPGMHTPIPGTLVTGVIAIEGAPVNGDPLMLYSREGVLAMDGSMGGKIHVRAQPGTGKVEAVYSGPLVGDPELMAQLARHATPTSFSVGVKP